MAVSFDVESDLPERLQGMRVRVADLREPFKLFNRSVENFFETRFDTAGRHGSTGGGLTGSRWKPLEPETKRARRRAGKPGNEGGVGRPLWATGNLRRSLIETGSESFLRIGRQTYVRGTRVPYAIYHQEGRGVPRRKIVPEPIPRGLQRRAARLIEQHVVEE